jgi:hypothetical protein
MFTQISLTTLTEPPFSFNTKAFGVRRQSVKGRGFACGPKGQEEVSQP